MIETILALLGTGASGGLVGGIFGLVKQKLESVERLEFARIEERRDAQEFQAAAAEREHAMRMLEVGKKLELDERALVGQLELSKVQTEAEAEIEIKHQESLASAQSVFASLKTSGWMDNYRASVRPTLAYAAFVMFCVMLGWAFNTFAGTIDEVTGQELLLGLFATLSFFVTSVGTFYYVARRNPAPRV